MDDLISRQAAIEAFERKQSHVERPITETRWFDLGLKKAQEVLSELPSAQPEIIRCKECEHYHPSYCEIWSKYGTVQTREMGYCYMAERRRR